MHSCTVPQWWLHLLQVLLVKVKGEVISLLLLPHTHREERLMMSGDMLQYFCTCNAFALKLTKTIDGYETPVYPQCSHVPLRQQSYV